MSEYWVSKKKYFCKYCDIYIADDAPSRQQHENGLRHKGNLERYIRGIYKAGEKRKKDLEEEKREMARVEQAAQAAYSADISAGRAKATSASREPSTSTAARKPAPKPSNPYANYSTAQSLGYTDPDTERLAAEAEVRRSQGVAGEWQIITPPPAASSSGNGTPQPEGDNSGDADDGTDTHAAAGVKREAEAPPIDEDARSFKLRKKTVAPGLGEIYDPGIIPIKLKKKEESATAPPVKVEPPASEISEKQDPGLPKWTSIQLKPIPLGIEGKGKEKENGESTHPATSDSHSKWTKVQWGAPQEEKEVKKEGTDDTFAVSTQSKMEPTEAIMEVEKESEEYAVKKEEPVSPPLPQEPEVGSGGIVFRKRKAPAGAGRGRRQI